MSQEVKFHKTKNPRKGLIFVEHTKQ